MTLSISAFVIVCAISGWVDASQKQPGAKENTVACKDVNGREKLSHLWSSKMSHPDSFYIEFKKIILDI